MNPGIVHKKIDPTFTYFVDQISPKVDMCIMMVGLNRAGKTTILYRLELGKHGTTIPTTDLDVETLEYKKTIFKVWDVGKTRSQWSRYLQNAQGLIFVVDSSDKDRVGEAKDKLHTLLNEDKLKDAIVLVFANKEDLPNAMETTEITHKLGLNNLQGRCWHIERTCATSGKGLYDGFNWLFNNIAIKSMEVSEPRTVFHLIDSHCIRMLKAMRADSNLYYDCVTPMNNFYNNHPDILFEKTSATIISVIREKKAKGFERKVSSGGFWKAGGGRFKIMEEGEKVADYIILTFYDDKKARTSWRIREYEVCDGADSKTICLAYNNPSQSCLQKLLQELDSARSPQEKPKHDKGKAKVVDGVRQKKKSHEPMQDNMRLNPGAIDSVRDIPLDGVESSSEVATGVREYEIRSGAGALKGKNDGNTTTASEEAVPRKPRSYSERHENVFRTEYNKFRWGTQVKVRPSVNALEKRARTYEQMADLLSAVPDDLEINDIDLGEDKHSIKEAVGGLLMLQGPAANMVDDSNDENSTKSAH